MAIFQPVILDFGFFRWCVFMHVLCSSQFLTAVISFNCSKLSLFSPSKIIQNHPTKKLPKSFKTNRNNRFQVVKKIFNINITVNIKQLYTFFLCLRGIFGLDFGNFSNSATLFCCNRKAKIDESNVQPRAKYEANPLTKIQYSRKARLTVTDCDPINFGN